MINCPRCGASNPDGNRFCGKCGQVLSASGMIDHSPPPAAELPEWLRESADDSTPATSSQPPAPNPPELPAWLSEIGLEDERQPASDLPPAPDWLAQLQETPPASGATEELPAWLRSNETPPAPSAATSPPAEQLPDWLRELESESPPPPASAPAPADELPAWLREDLPVADDRMSDKSGASELPEWLKDFGPADATSGPPSIEAGPAAAAPPSAPQEAPAWLSDLDTTPAQAAPPPADDIPPWLREDSTPAASTQTGASAQPAPPATPELPAWLMEDNTADAGAQDLNVPLPDWSSEFGEDLPSPESQDEPPGNWLADQPTAQAAPQTQPQASDDLPDWLRESAPITTPFAPAVPSSPVDTTPDWLREMEQPTQPAPAQQQSAPDDLPDWLRESTPVEASAPPQPASDESLPPWLLEESPTAAMPPAAPQQPAIPTEDLPSWLLDVDTPATSESSSAPSDALPPWLAEETPAAGQTTQPLPVSDPNATQALPSWLLDEPTSESGTTTPIAEPPRQTDELPSWLAADESTSATQPLDRHADELPSWLAADEPVTPPQAPEQHQDELPPWLAAEDSTPAVDAGRLAAQSPAQSQASSGETVEFPPWLSDSAPAQPPSSESIADADLPPWLSGIEAEAPTQPAEPTPALPAWLDETPEPAKPKQAAPQSEFLGGLDLPAWLREEGDSQQAAEPVKEVAPDWLQKISPEGEDTAPAQQSVAAPVAPRVVRSPERIESMRLLEQMLTEPAPEPLPAPAKRRRSWLPLLLGLILLLLVGAILFILLNPQLGLNFGAAPAPVPAASAAAQTIDGLAAQRPVVLAYEWDAQRLGDLRPLEETIIVHLASRRDVPLVFLSTDPQGTLLAAERAEQISQIADNYHNQYGLGYVNLGFKAGGPIALRQFAAPDAFGALFAQDASGNDLRANDVVMQSMCGSSTAEGCSWQNVGLLILMADELEDVRGWFEQVRSQHPDLPTLLLTTAEVTPQVEPYAAAASVHLLAGTSAAEAYSRARGMQDERLGRQVDAAAVGGAIFALLVVIGGPVAAFQGYRTRREAEVEEWEQ